jgi:hypothetical protein
VSLEGRRERRPTRRIISRWVDQMRLELIRKARTAANELNHLTMRRESTPVLLATDLHSTRDLTARSLAHHLVRNDSSSQAERR